MLLSYFLSDLLLIRSFLALPFTLQSSLNTLEKKNCTLELELKKALKDNNDTIEKLRELEQKNFELLNNMQRYHASLETMIWDLCLHEYILYACLIITACFTYLFLQ